MKTLKIHQIFILFLLLFGFSCNDETLPYEELTSSTEGVNLFIAKSVGGDIALPSRNEADYTPLPTGNTNFNVGYGGLGLPSNNINITLKVDTDYLDSLNQSRIILGLDPYLLFPTNAFDMDKTSVSINKGEQYSDLVIIEYYPEKFENENNYMLPVTIDDSGGYPVEKSTAVLTLVVNEFITDSDGDGVLNNVDNCPDEVGLPELDGCANPTPIFYNNTEWSVFDFSSEEAGGEGPIQGRANLILDGDSSTYWHSCWSCSPATEYPHNIIVDTKQINEFEGFQLYQRNGSRKVQSLEILLSDDAEAWNSLGDFTLMNNADEQLITLDNTASGQYIQLIFKSAYDGQRFAALAEMSAFYY